MYVVVEAPTSTVQATDLDAVETTFVSDGALPALLPGYEPRAQQVDMARRVAHAQNDGRVQIVEAGTGTGKSLAYLLPSAMRALANGEQVAVSTRTIHLQQQLLRKDAPIARRLFGDELEVSLLKAAGTTFASESSSILSIVDEGMEAAERDGLLQIAEWAARPRTAPHGSPFVDRDLWESVQSNTEHTLRVGVPTTRPASTTAPGGKRRGPSFCS